MVDTPEMPTQGSELIESNLPVNIEVASDTVFANIEKIVKDKRYSPEYKQELIQQEREKGLEAIEVVSTAVVDRLQKRVNDLRSLGNFRTSPPSEEVPALQYTLSALRSQWEKERTYEIDPPAILEQWEQAIVSGDRVTARVFSEHAAPAIQGFAKTDRDKMASLIERTQNMYLTDENREARQWLEKYDAFLKEAQHQQRVAERRLSSTRYERGKLIDGRDIVLPRTSF